jgi:hypothetical protein
MRSAWPPYRLENCTQLALHVYQDGVLDSYVVPLKPYESRAYTWDEQVASHCVRIRVVDAPYGEQFKSAVIKLDKLGTHDDVVLEGGGTEQTPPATLRMQVYCDGATRVLRITDIVRHAPDMTREESFQRFKERLQLAEAKRLADARRRASGDVARGAGGAAPALRPASSTCDSSRRCGRAASVASRTTATTTTTTTTTTFARTAMARTTVRAAARSPRCRAARRWRRASEFHSKELGTFEVTLTLDAIGCLAG